MSEHDNTSDQYEYVPMSVPYNDVAIGYGFGEGVGFMPLEDCEGMWSSMLTHHVRLV